MAVLADGVEQFTSFVAWAGFKFASHYSRKLWFSSRQGDNLQKTLILPLFVFSLSDPKQNARSFLTPVSGTVVYALSHGSLGFALHGSFFNHLLIG